MNWGVFTGLGHAGNMFLCEFCTRCTLLIGILVDCVESPLSRGVLLSVTQGV
jgi:hypothetical protein